MWIDKSIFVHILIYNYRVDVLLVLYLELPDWCHH